MNSLHTARISDDANLNLPMMIAYRSWWDGPEVLTDGDDDEADDAPSLLRLLVVDSFFQLYVRI